jgi:hypothetical protein
MNPGHLFNMEYKVKSEYKELSSVKIKERKEIQNNKEPYFNNILVANFKKNKDLEEYMKENPRCIRYISFSGYNKLILSKDQLFSLNVVANDEYNALITRFWGITDEKLLNILRQCRLDNPPKSFSYKTSKFAGINKKICDLFSIGARVENINRMNSLRNETLSEETNNKINKEYIEIEKYSYLSNIIFKKYMLFFYDLKKKAITPVNKLFIYGYYYICIGQEKYRTHKDIINDAENFLKYKINTPYWKSHLEYCDKIYKTLNDIFNSEKKICVKNTALIKSILKHSNDYFKFFPDPESLFLNDLMKSNINFDYYHACEYYKNDLPENLKIKYELRFIESKLINDYINILYNKAFNLNKTIKIKKNCEKLKKKYNKIMSILPEDIGNDKINNIPE